MSEPKTQTTPESLIADWDENGDVRYTLVGIKTCNKFQHDLILSVLTNVQPVKDREVTSLLDMLYARFLNMKLDDRCSFARTELERLYETIKWLSRKATG